MNEKEEIKLKDLEVRALLKSIINSKFSDKASKFREMAQRNSTGGGQGVEHKAPR